MEIRTLADLLALSPTELTLDHATVSIEGQRVAISSPAEVLGRTGFVSLVITSQGDGLKTTAAAGLSNLSLADMAALGWLDSAADVARLPSIAFPTVNLSPGSGKGRVAVAAPLPLADMLAAPPFGLADATLALELLALGSRNVPVSAVITATLGGFAVSLALPTKFSGWRLATAPGASKPLASLATDLDNFTGVGLSRLLPDGLPGGFSLSDLAAEIATDTRSVVAMQATVATTESWSIVTGVLVLERIRFTLRGRHYPPLLGADRGWTITGSLAASIELFGTAVEVAAGLGSATLSVSAQPMLTFPGIGAVAAKVTEVMGGSDFSAALPPALTSFASVTVEAFSVEIDTAACSLRSAAVTLAKPKDLDWDFPFLPGLTIADARFTLKATDPLASATRTLSGAVLVTGELGDAEVVLSIVRETGAPFCDLSLQSSDGVTLADLLGMIGLDEASLTGALPSSLSILSAFGLDRLDVRYDLTHNRATSTSLSLRLGDPWRIVPDHLEVAALSLDLSIERPTSDPAHRQILANLYGELEIAGAMFVARASNAATAGDGWVASIALEADSSISLTDIVTAVLPSGITLPPQFPAVTVDAASLEVTTATLATKAAFATSAHWAPTVLGKSGDMAKLSLALSIDRSSDNGTRPWELTVAGSLALAPLPTLSAVCVTGSGTTETEILAVLTPADVRTLSFDTIAAGFDGGTLASVPAPSGFAPPTLTSAAFYVNLTTPALLLFGQASRFGNAAFIVRALPQPSGAPASYGVALVMNTGPDFTFAKILPAEAGLSQAFTALDSLIRVKEASLTLSTFDLDTGAGNPFAAMDRLGKAAAALPSPVPIPAIPAAVRVKRGLNLDASLDLSTGTLWQGLSYIIEHRAGSPIAVHACFDPQVPGNSRFEASLGAFTILQTVKFDQVELVYLPNGPPPAASGSAPTQSAAPPSPSLTLSCAGSISIPTLASPPTAEQPDTDDTTILHFTGDLAVTETGMSAVLIAPTGAALRRPLGIPGLTLTSVGLAIDYAFTARADGSTERTLTRLAAQGTIKLCSVVDLTASVLFISGTAQVVLVELTKRVSINDVFNQCIGTDAFNGLPTITFKSGRLYQALADIPTTGGKLAYHKGFHLDATISLFDVDFALGVDIVAQDGMSGSATAVHSINFGFVELTGPAGGDTRPGLSLRAMKRSGEKIYALQFGFRLFGLDFINGSLAYQTGVAGADPIYSGAIAYHGSTPFGSDPSLKVEWTPSGGFKVVDWPGSLPIADLTKLMQAADANSACGALTALGLSDNFVQGKCETNINLSAGTKTPVVTVAIDLSYEVSVPNPEGGSRIVLNANTPPIKAHFDIAAPRDASIASLLEKVAEAAAKAVVSVIEAIVQDPAAMAAFVGAMAVKELSNAAINNLICRRVDNKALKDEYNERHKSDNGDKGDQADKELDKANENAAAAEAAATLDAAMAAAMTVATSVVAIGSFFASLLASLVHLFGGKTEEERRADRMNDAAQAAKNRADAAVRRHLAIAGLTVSYRGQGKLHVAWTPVDDRAGYQASIAVAGLGHSIPPLGDLLGLPQRTASADFEDSALSPGVSVTVSISASISYESRTWHGEPATLTCLIDDFGPHDLSVELVEGALQLAWAAGPNVASGWAVAASVTGDATVAPIAATLPADARSFSTRAFVPDRLYNVSVAPVGATYPDMPAAIPLATTALPTPSSISALYDTSAAALAVNWTAPVGALSGIRIQIRAGGTIIDQLANATDTSRTIPVATLADCRLRVGAVGGPVSGAQPTNWSAWTVFAPVIPAAPVITSLTYRPPVVLATWQQQNETANYDAQLIHDATSTPDRIVGTVSAAPDGVFQASFGGTFDAGTTIAVQVRGRTKQAIGPWNPIGADAQLTLSDIAAPTGLAAVNGDDVVHLQWAPGPAASDGYEVMVPDEAGVPLSPQPPQTATGPSSLDVNAAMLTDGTTYLIEVRSRSGRCYSPAASIKLTRAPEHPGQFLSLHNTLPYDYLEVTVLGPAAATVWVVHGDTVPLGVHRTSQAEVLHVGDRPDGLKGLTKAGISVTALGGQATLAWDDLAAGNAPVGITLTVNRGYRVSAGDIWPDLAPAEMARMLAPVVWTRAELAGALLDAYRVLDADDVAQILVGLGDTPSTVAAALAGVKDRLAPNPALRLAALAKYFAHGAARPSPLVLIAAFDRAEGGLSPAQLVHAVSAAYAALGQDRAASLAAFALAAATVSQADAIAALGADGRTAVAAAYGDSSARAVGLLTLLAALGFDPPTAVLAAGPLVKGADPSTMAAWLRTAFPSASLFMLLRILVRAGADPASAARAVAEPAPVDPMALAAALKALYSSPSTISGLRAAIAAGKSLGAAAKDLRDIYAPTALQLAAVLADIGGATDPHVLGTTLRAAGVASVDAAAALAELFPWLTPDDRAAFAAGA